MTNASLQVVRAGLQTTIQDEGRWGFQAQGVPVAGPMDPFAFRLANALVGNPRSIAGLEVAFIGPELEFEAERMVVVTGADFEITVDGAAAPHSQPFVIPASGRIKFGSRRRGARAYLAINGGIDAPMVLGSRATHVPSRMGGWMGRALASGDRVSLGATTNAEPSASIRFARRELELSATSHVVRILPGPDRDRFTEDALETLQSGPYAVGTNSDRMGFRLTGSPLTHVRGADLISDATPLGTLQVPHSGQPILLMADRQTTGGYPRIATVISADIGIAGQAAPGDLISFKICSPAEALTALIAREQRLLALEGRPS